MDNKKYLFATIMQYVFIFSTFAVALLMLINFSINGAVTLAIMILASVVFSVERLLMRGDVVMEQKEFKEKISAVVAHLRAAIQIFNTITNPEAQQPEAQSLGSKEQSQQDLKLSNAAATKAARKIKPSKKSSALPCVNTECKHAQGGICNYPGGLQFCKKQVTG